MQFPESNITSPLSEKTNNKRHFLANKPQFYLHCPSTEAPIESLWEIAAQRLQLLQEIDKLRSRGASFQELTSAIEKFLFLRRQQNEYYSYENIITDRLYDTESRDVLSHYLLRLAFCKQQNAQAWFLQNETVLFQWRLENSPPTQIDTLIDQLQAVWSDEEISLRKVVKNLDQDPEFAQLYHRLYQKLPSSMTLLLYQVPFEQVPELLRHRSVIIRSGYAYLFSEQLTSFLVSRFRSVLSKGLGVLRKMEHFAEEQEQLNLLLESLRESQKFFVNQFSSYSLKDAENLEKAIHLEDLPQAMFHMPLCMFRLMKRLEQNHHLKHGARLQLGLFLKDCGLSMDESLHFWKTEFSKGGISSDKFDKEYAYAIRHHYGREGKRASYTPFSCMKIIQQRPSAHEEHGCPFRELNSASLDTLLQTYGVEEAGCRASIVQKAQEGHFQVACGMTMQMKKTGQQIATSSEEFSPTTTHPNHYFFDSLATKENLSHS
ncbi:DNA primase large subunit [Galdieria sulphuraria]|uniref:DNA primase large subunit n=1 Tax=Galdieria sulphuraria TaxID=130081 RepID=M2Y607_GALSU|nr:DNA primase large subunit [Galdieria sulphuraria]EME31418.1 DNA primase large subunit [Galdieria sulphuraria]|eukprot:XP_005707938.1 DNA primase large subunit [Galdieria sulphuraria]